MSQKKEKDASRVDIICRVFQIKLFQVLQHLKKKNPFGKIVACKYRVLHILDYITANSYNTQPKQERISITQTTNFIINIYITLFTTIQSV